MSDLTSLGILEASALLRERKLSPVELTRAHLDRIARVDSQINSYITVTAEAALDAAQRAEAEIMRGEWRGHLHGIPIALKDLYETAGVRTTLGSQFFADHVPNEDAFAVQKLKAAGAVILGKTNLHEIALGVTNDNPHYGACRNPWDTRRSPGGSSGGSGAALGAGLCMGTLGSDTRGSIRHPASLCGVTGLKPTYGVLSVRGVLPLSPTLDHVGPMARSAVDCAALFDAIYAVDPADPYQEYRPAARPFVTKSLGRAYPSKIIMACDAYFESADAEILAAVERAVQVFREMGTRVIDVEIGGLEDLWRASQIITQTEAAAFHRERLAARPEDFGADVRARLETGLRYVAADYAEARRTQVIERHRLAQIMTDIGAADGAIVLTPATPLTAPRFDDPAEMEAARPALSRFSAPWNMAGFPAMSLPCGFTGAGLPIGLQLVGAAYHDGDVLAVGHAYQSATDWHRRRPAL